MPGIIQPLTRRTFVRVATRGLLATVVSGSLLQACGRPAAPAPSGSGTGSTAPASTGAGSSGTAAKAGRVQLPTYVPFQGPTPDLAGTTDGLVAPGYRSFPKNLVRTVTQPPGKGGDVEALTATLSSPPPAPDQNPAWAQVNKELGINLKMPIINTSDYAAKLSTTVAGGSLPDILSVSIFGTILQDLEGFLEAACADLTPYLSGDAVKEFPNLANFPTSAWPPTIFNNKIYTVPLVPGGASAGPGGGLLMAQWKLFDEIGVAGFKNTDDFTKALKQITIPNQRWAVGGGSSANPASLAGWLSQLFGGANQWRESGGKFVRSWETDEFRQAVVYGRSLWDAGVVHPESLSLGGSKAGSYFYSSKMGMWTSSFNVYQTVWDRAVGSDPAFKPRAVVPFGHDGKSQPVQLRGSGVSGLVALQKASPERIKELLGVLNYLSAPFGSEEHLLLNYGVKDAELKFDGAGNPTLTQQGAQDLTVPWRFLVAGPDVWYHPTSADYAEVGHKLQSDLKPIGIDDPTTGLYSKTNGQKGAGIDRKFNEAVAAILFGQANLGTLNQAIDDWRKNGGDQIRAEYEQALGAARA